MKQTKTEIRFFPIPAWKKEENYLRKQHQNGWEFISVNGLCLYHFRRCEPNDVIYQLDYNPDSLTNKHEYLAIADGNTCKIMWGTVIFARLFRTWMEPRNRSSVTIAPGWK